MVLPLIEKIMSFQQSVTFLKLIMSQQIVGQLVNLLDKLTNSSFGQIFEDKVFALSEWQFGNSLRLFFFHNNKNFGFL